MGDASPAVGEEGGGGSTGQVADIKVNFRLAKPDSDDFWENTITERLQVRPTKQAKIVVGEGGRGAGGGEGS